MTEIIITPLHCGDCSKKLIALLEKETGLTGFAYDEAENSLTLPDNAPMEVVRALLDAEKVAVCHHIEDGRCLCPQCEYGEGAPTDTHCVCDEHDHGCCEGHGHSHRHEHHHDHGHAHGGSVRNVLIVFLMNLLFSASEFIFGALFRSTAIFADAVHDLGDALSVGLAFILEKQSKQHSDRRYTFGRRRFSLLGALITGIVLITGSLFALYRSVPKLLHPLPVNYDGMLVMAILAILMNAVSAWALSRGHSRSESMLNLHMLEDMLGWVGILIISLVLRFTDWYFLDPLFSILISLFILYEAVPQVASALRILMESVPEEVDMEHLSRDLLALRGVHGLRHLHLWSMDGESNNCAVTLFTTLSDAGEQRRIRLEARQLLAPFHVECSTIEIDLDPDKRFTGDGEKQA